MAALVRSQYSPAQTWSRSFLVLLAVVISAHLVVATVQNAKHLPIPAPDIPTQCNSVERCCMPRNYTGTPGIRQFQFDPRQPWRVRRPAHLLSDTEIQRLERAYMLMRELPDSDPRSLLNQKNLHCLYCDNALEYEGQEYPLEIHNGWYFLPWHRMFVFWHERILAKLLNDSSFALPFWAWDNQQDTDPAANVMPPPYANPNSSLYDAIRNNCSQVNPYVDLDARACATDKTAEYMRTQNNRLLYSQLVVGAPTPALFYGMPYYFGDIGGRGPGTLEDSPHLQVHAWVGDPYPPAPYRTLDDMGNFGRSAYDPTFYPHHANVDRLWWIWMKNIAGGERKFPQSEAFNQTQFTFYDENANLVKMDVSQVLDTDLLRYKYEDLASPWITNGVEAGKENSVALCNPLSKSQVNRLIRSTRKFNSSENVLSTTPLTFRVKRPPRSSEGMEVLEFSGIHIPKGNSSANWVVYLFYPQAVVSSASSSTAWCPEFAGTCDYIPHTGQASYNPTRVWRVAVGSKLKQLGLDFVDSVVVTVVQTTAPPGQNITFDRARIMYDLSSSVTL